MSLQKETPCSDPWDKIVQGALSLACTAQRHSVLKTGEHVFGAVLGKKQRNLRDSLGVRLLANIKAVIDVNDDYEWNRLIHLLDDVVDDPVRLREVVEWGLTSKNEEVLTDAKALLVELS